MDSIEIPIYRQQDNTTIKAALRSLRTRKRGGLLVQNHDQYRLLFAGDLLRARRDGVAHVQDISGGERVIVTTEEHAVSHRLDLLEPHRTASQFEQFLDFYQYRYALPEISRRPTTRRVEIRSLVTRFESLGAMLNMTGGYECDGEPKHYFPEPYVRAGDLCPLRPECSRPDGNTPRIVAAP